MRRLALGVLALVCGSVVPSSAQSVDQLKESVRLLQAQVDALQAKADAPTPTPAAEDSRLRLYMDGGFPGPMETFMFFGWGFSCDGRATQAIAMVDGIQVAVVAVARVVRADVTKVFAPWCPAMPAGAGLTFLLDLKNFSPGKHTVALRLIDDRGRIETSNAVEITR